MLSTEKKAGKVDWLLLIFLLLFTNQAIFSLKIVGLVFICLARWNWNFDVAKGRLSKFFGFILLLATFNFLFIIRDFSSAYIVAFIVGNLFWIFSFIASHQVKLSLEKFGHEGIYKTMKIFIVINFLACIWQLLNIMSITHMFNPYSEYLEFPYGMSTGDNVFGSFMQNSYYNVMVSSLLAVYFLFKRNLFFAILSSTCLILVFGNFGTMVFVGILTGLFLLGIFASMLKKDHGFVGWVKQIIPPSGYYLYAPLMIFIAFIFYITLSPRNYDYIIDKFKETVLTITVSDKNNYASMITNQDANPKAFDPFNDYFRQVEDSIKNAREIVNNVIATKGVEHSTLAIRKELTDVYIRRLQGKNLSVTETREYLFSSPTAFLFGAGTTRFSSLTAQKMSGYDSSRLFMNVLPRYKSKLYAENHYLLIDGRETAGDDALLSSANWPDSLYNQLFGEYGVLGALIFLIYYLGFYAKRMKYWSYTFWLMCIFLPFAHLNYIFDTLCVAPFLELLIESDISEHLEQERIDAG